MKHFGFLVALSILFSMSLRAFSADMVFSDIRIAMELQEDAVLVKEMIIIKPTDSRDAPNPDGFVVLLPPNAGKASLALENPSDRLSINEKGVQVNGPIPSAGRQIALMYLLPIKNGKTVFEQSLNASVQLVHAAFVGDIDGRTLSGQGFGASNKNKTPSGLPALFITGKDFDDGHILLIIDGFGEGPLYYITAASTIFSFLVLIIGFILWINRRVSKDADVASWN